MKRDVLIVGGGPAGLLLAHHFQEDGIDYHVLERGKVAQAWRAMRPGMVLLSPSVPGTDWTSLTLQHPLWTLPGVRKPFPTREDFLCYVEAFSREHALSIGENVAATKVVAAPGGFRVSTTAGESFCRFLVLASGASTSPAFPDIPGIPLNSHVVHSCDFVHCMAYAGKRVLIIGGGNSAAEIAIELAGTARGTLCTRGPVRLGWGDEREFDWILCATGYRPKWIPIEGGEIQKDTDGYPVISGVGESTVPGLYLCGSLARFNRRCAFIHGFRNYVEKVFWDIADRL